MLDIKDTIEEKFITQISKNTSASDKIFDIGEEHYKKLARVRRKAKWVAYFVLVSSLALYSTILLSYFWLPHLEWLRLIVLFLFAVFATDALFKCFKDWRKEYHEEKKYLSYLKRLKDLRNTVSKRDEKNALEKDPIEKG